LRLDDLRFIRGMFCIWSLWIESLHTTADLIFLLHSILALRYLDHTHAAWKATSPHIFKLLNCIVVQHHTGHQYFARELDHYHTFVSPFFRPASVSCLVLDTVLVIQWDELGCYIIFLCYVIARGTIICVGRPLHCGSFPFICSLAIVSDAFERHHDKFLDDIAFALFSLLLRYPGGVAVYGRYPAWF